MTVEEILGGIPKRQRNDAVWLLSALLNASRADILLNTDRVLKPEEARQWRSWWRKRNSGEPLQYVAGTAPFWGRDFFVNRSVLIPRPETEVLVDLSLRLLKGLPQARVLDIGTGSGAIAITLKAERTDLIVTASDISSKAIEMARCNSASLGVEGISFTKQNLFSKKLQQESWDLIVSNPPYLDFNKDKIAENVKKWEPRLALEPDGSSRISGLDRASWCAEKILIACQVSPPRFTAFELSPRVAASLEKRWRKKKGVARVWREADLAGRKRFLLIAWENGVLRN